jgi:hypothetical protein
MLPEMQGNSKDWLRFSDFENKYGVLPEYKENLNRLKATVFGAGVHPRQSEFIRMSFHPTTRISPSLSGRG